MIHRVRAIRSNLHLEYGVRARHADSLHSNPDASQILSQAPVIDGEIDELANPLRRKFHCSLKSSVILKRVLCAEGPLQLAVKTSTSRSSHDAFAVLFANAQRPTTVFYAHCCKNLTSP